MQWSENCAIPYVSLVDGGMIDLVRSLGVLRSYATRHGHGPFVTEDRTLTKELPDAKNHDDAWQGNFRVGHFDAVASRYAVLACGPKAFDGLVLTCLDRTAALDTWSCCTAYRYDDVRIDDLMSLKNANHTELSGLLSRCTPIVHQNDQRGLHDTERQRLQIEMIAEQVGLPVYATSNGVTERDKYLHEV